MSEKVNREIAEIVVTKNMCFDNTLTAIGDVVFKIFQRQSCLNIAEMNVGEGQN